MGKVIKALAAVTASALLAGSVQAACWTDKAYQAAQVRELDTMLMVEALRCRKTEANFVNEYNRFIQVSRPALLQANAALRGHFAAEAGVRGALNAYDNYMTTVANRYGAGSEGLSCSDIASIVQAAIATNGSGEELYRIAATAQMTPMIEGDRCASSAVPAVTIASRR